MITIRHAQDRGQASFGWLDSKHTFSFGQYYDPQQMGFSALRVINDDRVQPGSGFDTHGHRDMEIMSYVLQGTMTHKDSEGHIQVLPAGEFQLMSAGKGIYHSEYNASDSEPLCFLQIWIEPDVQGTQPGYQQKDFGQTPGLTLVASPSGEQGSLQLKQDARLFQLILEPQSELTLDISVGRKVYIHQIDNALQVDSATLSPGDGAKVQAQQTVRLYNNGDETAKALVFDLP
jgi:redox-sensitive bicupin YhaK (pirin superfamily)